MVHYELVGWLEWTFPWWNTDRNQFAQCYSRYWNSRSWYRFNYIYIYIDVCINKIECVLPGVSLSMLVNKVCIGLHTISVLMCIE